MSRNKQLNCSVKKTHTHNRLTYWISEAYFIIKSLWKNCVCERTVLLQPRVWGPHEDVKIQVFQSLGRPQYKPYSFTRHHRRASLLKVCYSRYFFSVKFWVRRSKHWAIRPQMAEHSSIWDILQGNLRYAFQVSKYDMRLVFLKNCPLGGGSVISPSWLRLLNTIFTMKQDILAGISGSPLGAVVVSATLFCAVYCKSWPS